MSGSSQEGDSRWSSVMEPLFPRKVIIFKLILCRQLSVRHLHNKCFDGKKEKKKLINSTLGRSRKMRSQNVCQNTLDIRMWLKEISKLENCWETLFIILTGLPYIQKPLHFLHISDGSFLERSLRIHRLNQTPSLPI